MTKLDLSFYQECGILLFVGVFLLMVISLAVENRELKKLIKRDTDLKTKQRKIIAFYRTYMLTRYGKVFTEEVEETRLNANIHYNNELNYLKSKDIM